MMAEAAAQCGDTLSVASYIGAFINVTSSHYLIIPELCHWSARVHVVSVQPNVESIICQACLSTPKKY